MCWSHIRSQLRRVESKFFFTNQLNNGVFKARPFCLRKFYYSTSSSDPPNDPKCLKPEKSEENYKNRPEKYDTNNTDDKNESGKSEKKRYEVEGVPVPDHLVQFIVVEEFLPLVTFYDLSGLKSDSDELEPWENPSESIIFENNNLLREVRRRLKLEARETVSQEKIRRLRRMSGTSYSHGISWDSLDNLYFEFYRAKNEAVRLWDEHNLELVEYANRVSANKISNTKSLSEFKASGRLLKVFTQQYYNRWFAIFLSPYSNGMLLKYLRTHVTLALLNRESLETTGKPLNLDFKQSPRNPYFREL